jgi:8-oxo-dGTP diphosphatase
MELLAELSDKDFFSVSSKELLEKACTLRRAARMILINYENQIALMHVTCDKYHKLPGGGIEGDEDIQKALIREVLEESGFVAQVLQEVGIVIEERLYPGEPTGFFQISYCFFGKLVREGKQSLTKSEKERGFKLVWVSIREGIAILEKEKPSGYSPRFINKRDVLFLKKGKEMLKNLGKG